VPAWQYYAPPPTSTAIRPQPWSPSLTTPLGSDFPLLPRALREPEQGPARATIQVRVPPGAEVWFQGAKTKQTGAVRLFESPPLEPRERYAYDIKARWTEGGKEMERTLRVYVWAGARSEADFTQRVAK
jgi:uncharacterized protein (TIGR03000 family)